MFAFSVGCLLLLVGIHFCWWAFIFAGGGVIFAGGGLFALVGICFHWWAFVFAGGGLSGVVVSHWWLGGSFCSWASAFVSGRSSPFVHSCVTVTSIMAVIKLNSTVSVI